MSTSVRRAASGSRPEVHDSGSAVNAVNNQKSRVAFSAARSTRRSKFSCVNESSSLDDRVIVGRKPYLDVADVLPLDSAFEVEGPGIGEPLTQVSIRGRRRRSLPLERASSVGRSLPPSDDEDSLNLPVDL